MRLAEILDDAVFELHWYFTVERQYKKELKKFEKSLDHAVEVLDEAISLKPCENMSDFISKIESDKRKILVKAELFDELYKQMEESKTEIQALSETLHMYYPDKDMLCFYNQKRKRKEYQYQPDIDEINRKMILNLLMKIK